MVSECVRVILPVYLVSFVLAHIQSEANAMDASRKAIVAEATRIRQEAGETCGDNSSHAANQSIVYRYYHKYFHHDHNYCSGY